MEKALNKKENIVCSNDQFWAYPNDCHINIHARSHETIPLDEKWGKYSLLEMLEWITNQGAEKDASIR